MGGFGTGVELSPRCWAAGTVKVRVLMPLPACRVPDNSLPYFHKRPQVRTLLLALLCATVSVVWGIFRNEDQ